MRKLAFQVGKVFAQEVGRKRIKARSNRSVGREHIARPRRPERFPEIELLADGELTGPLDHGERGVAFVYVANLRFRMQLLHKTPPAYAEHDLLHQPDLRCRPPK